MNISNLACSFLLRQQVRRCSRIEVFRVISERIRGFSALMVVVRRRLASDLEVWLVHGVSVKCLYSVAVELGVSPATGSGIATLVGWPPLFNIRCGFSVVVV
ncbi:hypothetical protein TSUD_63170 [Trifolium subterraneum]|uniref:Uncharacterized protein n=1 Tax=Trifolium subterraneum TaxID=3900 RepID=A0A2Z6N7U9_TRISU|nr:hypothetical protein TSUD_63170 [Trifolium subterraneum]